MKTSILYSVTSKFFDTSVLHSSVRSNLDLSSYDVHSINLLTSLAVSHTPKFGKGSIDTLACIYLYIALTAILSTTDGVSYLNRANVPVKLPIFNVLLLKNIAIQSNVLQSSTGYLYGRTSFLQSRAVYDYLSSRDVSNLEHVFLAPCFSSYFEKQSDKILFVNAIKNNLSRCFSVSDNDVKPNYIAICNSIEFCTHGLNKQWVTETFVPDNNSIHLGIHRFRSSHSRFICETKGISDLSGDKLDSFVCFLYLFNPSFFLSEDGIKFEESCTSLLPGDSYINIQDLHPQLIFNLVVNYTIGVKTSPISKVKEKEKSDSDTYTSVPMDSEVKLKGLGGLQTNAVKPKVPKRNFSTYQGFTYINKQSLVPVLFESSIVFVDRQDYLLMEQSVDFSPDHFKFVDFKF